MGTHAFGERQGSVESPIIRVWVECARDCLQNPSVRDRVQREEWYDALVSSEHFECLEVGVGGDQKNSLMKLLV